MTGHPVLDTILALAAALASLWGLYTGGRKALADARATKTPATPYEALAARVTALETADADKGKEISRLRRQVRRLAGALAEEVTHILDWIDRGAEPPPPAREISALRQIIRDLDRDTPS